MGASIQRFRLQGFRTLCLLSIININTKLLQLSPAPGLTILICFWDLCSSIVPTRTLLFPRLLLLYSGRPVDDYNRLLHVVIVGGGPTGVEVAGELSNLINRDLKNIYPDRAKAMRWVTVTWYDWLDDSIDSSHSRFSKQAHTWITGSGSLIRFIILALMLQLVVSQV